MLAENIKLIVDGKEIEVSKDTTLLEISKMIKYEGRRPIIARINDAICELNAVPNENDRVEFLDCTDSSANRIYVNGLILVIN